VAFWFLGPPFDVTETTGRICRTMCNIESVLSKAAVVYDVYNTPTAGTIVVHSIVMNVVDWIGLAQDRYRWRALVNSVRNLRYNIT
jgi:hypothetical protein